MPTLEYARTDLVVTLRLASDGLEVETAFGAIRARLGIPGFDPARLMEIDVSALSTDPADAWALAARGAAGDGHLARVVLRVEGRALAAAAWERLVPRLVDASQPPSYAVVRDTPVPPRDHVSRWTLPLRIVHVDAAGARVVRQAVDERFGRFAGAEAENAVRVRELAPGELSTWTLTEDWPNAEVIHLERLPSAPPGARLSTARAGEVGTLGWLARLTELAQTRLLVLEAADGGEEADARALAAGLVARGGPAVLVLRDPGRDAIIGLYDLLIHDRPLDWIARELQGRGEIGGMEARGGATLFAGAGREEAVRVSGPGARLLELAGRLAYGDPAAESDLMQAVAEAAAPAGADPTLTGGGPGLGKLLIDIAEARGSLAGMRDEWQYLRFEQHESAGLIPYSANLARIRDRILGRPDPRPRKVGRTASPVEGIGAPQGTDAIAAGPPRRHREESATTRDDGDEGLEIDKRIVSSPAHSSGPSSPPPEPGAPRERWVVPSLWAADEPGEPAEVPQPGGRLVLGRLCHLGIRIGARDEETRVVGAASILEEVFKWRAEDEGAWVEVGVTGIGFDVLGSPVQELWLPRGGDTETLRFAVVPREAVSVLRYTLYHRGSAVQSFRLAAATVHDALDPPGDATDAIAAALGLDPHDVGQDGWLARMEFSLVGDAAGIETRPARTLSIVANDLGGRPVVTVKGADSFDVWFPGNVAPQVQRLRGLLDQVATEKTAAGAAYNFGRADAAHPNAGDEATLKRALIALAEGGWDLYTQLLDATSRASIAKLLDDGDGETIQVAHVLLDKVLPWSLLYDRPFTPNAQVDAAGNVLAVDACLAALPAADGTPSTVRCGEHPCILAAGDPRFTRDTVACPRHFWGFRHAVEIPPQQVPPGGAPAPQVDVVESGTPANLVSGFNDSLPLARAHLARLEALEQGLAGRAKWTVKEFAGQFITHHLDAADVDLVYLYCHARGGAADLNVSPCLEFVGLRAAPRRVAPGDLAGGTRWAHHPLVILNGCGTVGFSPDALSPFLPILVRDRGAAGVLGTEISVWEQLAGEFAEHFLGAFLAGKTAGDALLHARRRLLAQRNPLGLAYTLYASAGLHFSLAAPTDPPAGG